MMKRIWDDNYWTVRDPYLPFLRCKKCGGKAPSVWEGRSGDKMLIHKACFEALYFGVKKYDLYIDEFLSNPGSDGY